MKSKKGISEFVSYALLVIIAIALGVIVYNYLTYMVPKPKPECTNEATLVIQDMWCKTGDSNGAGTLNITFLNKGLFNVDAVYIRFGAENRKILDLVNGEGKEVYFENFVGGEWGLKPGETLSKQVSISSSLMSAPGTYNVQIEPAEQQGDYLALCADATLTRKIECTAT